jgi:hypothetical protein
MTQKNVDVEVSGMDSKLSKVTLTILSVLMIFIGPTYIPYVLADQLHLEYFASIGIGAALFIVGLVLMVFLIRKKVIT